MNTDFALFNYFLSSIEQNVIFKKYAKGDLIFNESDVEERIYIVKSGKVEIFKLNKKWEERIIFILSKGAILNEEILYSKNSECATCCRAYEDSEVAIVSKNVTLNAIQKDAECLKFFYNNSNNKLKRTYRQLKNSGTNITIEKKIASKLWKLALDFGIERNQTTIINIRITSTILAKMIGAKRETVSRCLNKFKSDGIVEIKGDLIIILDKNKLSSVIEEN